MKSLPPSLAHTESYFYGKGEFYSMLHISRIQFEFKVYIRPLD